MKRRSSIAWACVGLAGLVFAAGGCALLRAPSEGLKAIVRMVQGTTGIQQTTNTISLVQTKVMREAETYVTVLAEAVNGFAARAGTEEARVAALEWKLHEGNSAFSIAAGENPFLNAVDFVILATLSRQVVEDYWVGQKFGKAAVPLLETQRTLETNAWSLVSGMLTPEQQAELRDLIQKWSEKHPHQHYVAAIRLRDFLAVLGSNAMSPNPTQASTIINLLNLDPFSELNPSVREVARTRVFGERLMFYFQHFPMLLSWQVEELSYQVAAQPAPQLVVCNLTEFAESARVFAHTSQQLPELVNRQREEAINQVFDRLATERSNVLASLNAQESQLRELVPQVRQTLVAGSQMGASLNGAITSLDQFVRYVSPPHTNPASPVARSHSFNVAEYGTAATQIAAMSIDLDQLLARADRSATQLTVVGERVEGGAKRVVDQAFWRGAALIMMLLVGSVLAGLTYRFLARRLDPNPNRP
jgi:hypothetical protein